MSNVRDPSFSFTVTDAARFLGKSPVTLRKWESQGFYKFARVGNDRRLSVEDVRSLARHAYEAKRICESRLNLIEASLTLLGMVEEYENRTFGSTGNRKVEASSRTGKRT